MSKLLDIQGVTSGYENTEILHNVSLGVEEGSVTALLGRNGVGKTTTLRTVMGILKPTAGSIYFNNEEITGNDPDDIYSKGVGMVPEDRKVFPDLTVRENLQVPITSSGSGEREIEELFDFFPKLRTLQDSNGSNLSGGEQQMLVIARALRSNPRLIMLDEPTEGLAPQIVENVAEIIQEVSELGTTVLLVEQNIKLSLDLSDYAYIMDMGEIAVEGPSNEIAEDEDLIQRHLGVEQ